MPHPLTTRLLDLLHTNKYLTLATTDGEKPWASPLFYCLDEKFHFYFISKLDSQHVQNMQKNPHVSFAVFDSHVAEVDANGVQGSGVVTMLEGERINHGLKYYSTPIINLSPENLSGESPWRLFKLVPDHLYILHPETDLRIEVVLN